MSLLHLRSALSAPALLALAMLLVALLPTAGLAHTGLESSAPSDGTSVESVDTIALVFTKPIEVFDDSLRLTGEDGETSILPPVRSGDGLTITGTPEQPLPAGTWTVTWRILAEDSHPRDGVFTFVIDDPADTSTAAPGEGATSSPTDPPSRPASAASPPSDPGTSGQDTAAATVAGASGLPLERLSAFFRIVFYLGLMVAIGLALFKAGPHSGQLAGAIHLARWVVVAATIALGAGVLEVVVHVAVVSGRGVAGAFSPNVWSAVLDTGLGTALWLRIAGLGLLLWGGRHRIRNEQVSSPDLRKLVGAGLAIASFQFVGHTASAAPAVIVRTADAAHAIAAAVWIGGLVGLAVVTRHGSTRTRAHVIGRFSSWATAAVTGVAIAGVALAVTNLPSISAAWETWYGQLLLIKLLLVGGLATLGAYNHYRIVPRIIDGHDGYAIAALRRTVSFEIVLAVVIVATTALLVNTSPT